MKNKRIKTEEDLVASNEIDGLLMVATLEYSDSYGSDYYGGQNIVDPKSTLAAAKKKHDCQVLLELLYDKLCNDCKRDG